MRSIAKGVTNTHSEGPEYLVLPNPPQPLLSAERAEDKLDRATQARSSVNEWSRAPHITHSCIRSHLLRTGSGETPARPMWCRSLAGREDRLINTCGLMPVIRTEQSLVRVCSGSDSSDLICGDRTQMQDSFSTQERACQPQVIFRLR